MDKDFIAKEYIAMHAKKKFSGASLEPHIKEIKSLIKEYDCQTILDYGCGQAQCHKDGKIKGAALYDPYVDRYSVKPEGVFDLVICTDVMEHVPEDEVGKTLTELMNYTNKVLYLAIATYPANKKFSNGENVHVTIKPKEWWESMLSTARDIKIVRKYT
jgi:hypothetical protein